uniref:Thioredoxin domain-containing protein n=1 Tax=Mucochytrium quahogii TaxID=96639 RepID=A0A7S2SMY5_9STRA|mmetsp:Transcript_19179/g.31442  ORF Transcript_19179/g.31442 Transcript_19179/m.31442 type:complete len:139 (+) Transcript_19179:172-588(+)
MKPDWDKLSDQFESSSSVAVADVDCTVHQDLCSKHDVSGYPTIKYYKDGDKKGEAYQGGRDFDSLEKFVKDTLEKPCQVADPSTCTEKEQKFITKVQAWASDKRAKEIERLEKMKSGSMKPELKSWLLQRIHILKQSS